METKKRYINENEIKVKNLLSDIYENESRLLKHIHKKKDQLAELENEYKHQKKIRNDLMDKFDKLKDSGSSDWEDNKAEFEMTLSYAEGDKDSFVQLAESILNDINEKISEGEEKMKEAADKSQEKLSDLIEDLKTRKNELQEKLNEVREDSGEKWKDIKHWFFEKSKTAKEYFQSLIL